jgi:ATP-dependent phosphofructokinase / diphosphate-dependent phosphofructokinase
MNSDLSLEKQVLKDVASDFISADGFGITEAARRYLAPLIVGEAYPPFKAT